MGRIFEGFQQQYYLRGVETKLNHRGPKHDLAGQKNFLVKYRYNSLHGCEFFGLHKIDVLCL